MSKKKAARKPVKKAVAKKLTRRSLATAKKAVKKSPSIGIPIVIVLDLLRSMRYPDPKPKSNIRTWFADCEKIDKELGLTHTRTDVFLEELFASPAFFGVTLGKSELLEGQYRTPQAIADLAG